MCLSYLKMNETVSNSELNIVLQNGDLDELKVMIRKLLKENPNWRVNHILDEKTMLHMSAYYGHLHITEFLVNNGANMNKMDSYCFTPLLCALWKNHLEVAKYLATKGARTRYQTSDGRRYFECTKDPEMRKLLKLLSNR